MDSSHELETAGPFEAPYLAFLETISDLRPSLHRYCSRMTGSVLDGEDVVQEALFRAYRTLDTFDDERPLAPWLFRLAHNHCIDFLRRQRIRKEAEVVAARIDTDMAVDPSMAVSGRTIEHLVLRLPPTERACLLLKDVLDYSLKDIAEVVGSTVSGVKAALSRGRSKLATLPKGTMTPRASAADVGRLLHLYVERFTQRDWDGVRDLIAADARLQVADRFAGPFMDSPYFTDYERATVLWRLAVGEVDGEPAIILVHRRGEAWVSHSVVHLDVTDDRITRVADYWYCPWILQAATSILASEPPWRPWS